MNDIDAFRAGIRGIELQRISQRTSQRTCYWTRKRIACAILCVALHVFIVVNVWYAYQLTPRVINVLPSCKQPAARGVTI